MAKKGNRPFLRLECSECGSQNYTTTKSRVNTQEKLELKKFCPKCRKHTIHKEVKI
ncbi:50S ribosomal protein L33 [Candidatus Saccharibacteria bacterium]|nr:50S ribosomal protein L33 [Candidatus Saccharibacteria bacterium]